MEIRIQFETSNAAFQDYPAGDGDFDKEVECILNQALHFIIGDIDNDVLIDSNGNKVGTVWRSTANRRG